MMSSYHQTLFTISSAFILMILLTGSVSEGRNVAVPSPQCHPSVVNSMPPRIRKICDALQAILDLSDSMAMDTYVSEKDSEEEVDPELVSAALGERRPMNSVGVKRKGDDVDHVFLRFGKRA